MSMTKVSPVTKAVFPVAGMGTRFLPATKAIPKEMLNIVDKPLIQYAVEEAIAAGITEMIFVTGRNKHAIEDHFDKSYELEVELEAKNKQDLLSIVRNIKPSHINCSYTRQSEALGLGHAVLCAEALVRGVAFAVILPDVHLQGDSNVLFEMLGVYKNNGASVLAVEEINPEQSPSYGVIEAVPKGNGLHQLRGIVEKPQPKDAPSKLGVVGRYILTPAIFNHIRNLKPGAGGEYQLTDGIKSLLQVENVMAYEFNETRYDCGNKLGYLKATIDFALKHPEIRDDFYDTLISAARLSSNSSK